MVTKDQNIAALFLGQTALSDGRIRRSVIRIPEVSIRIKEAQKILDEAHPNQFDLNGFLIMDDLTFSRLGAMRSLLTSIVQLALFERGRKHLANPITIFIDELRSESAIDVANGQITLSEMVLASEAVRDFGGVVTRIPRATDTFSLPTGSGDMTLPINQVSNRDWLIEMAGTASASLDGKSRKRFESKNQSLEQVMARLSEDHGIDSVLLIGPTDSRLRSVLKLSSIDRVKWMDSVEADPMLSWFWSTPSAPLQNLAN